MIVSLMLWILPPIGILVYEWSYPGVMKGECTLAVFTWLSVFGIFFVLGKLLDDMDKRPKWKADSSMADQLAAGYDDHIDMSWEFLKTI